MFSWKFRKTSSIIPDEQNHQIQRNNDVNLANPSKNSFLQRNKRFLIYNRERGRHISNNSDLLLENNINSNIQVPREVSSLNINNNNNNNNSITDNNSENNRDNQITPRIRNFSPPPAVNESNLRSYNAIPSTPPPQYSPRRYNPVRAIQVQVIQPQNQQNNEISSTSSDDDNDEISGFFRRRSVSLGRRRLRGRQFPDLLHSCSLILTSQPEENNENEISQPGQSTSDYAEIDEIIAQYSTLQTRSYNLTKSQPSLKKTESPIECATQQIKDFNEYNTQRAMGQNLSLRRPRISMTWVLREQQPSNSITDTKSAINEKKKFNCKNNSTTNKNSNNCNNNGSTSSSKEDQKIITEKCVNDLNLQEEHQEKREPSKDLLFVCTPQKQPFVPPDGCFIAPRRRSETGRRNSSGPISAKHADRILDRNFKVSESVLEGFVDRIGDGAVTDVTTTKSLKGTYSEPSLIAASEGGGAHHRRHKHRKRRSDRNKAQKFGYEIRNVDDFLSKCSLASPGNIPVVLASSSILYQTRPGGYQIEIPLPLGMVVNAVFKNENWLYVQTPHAEEGYVGYSSCLPLGILPPPRTSKSTPCWENNGDIFPKPCGNMTDSEKEIHLRGTRSDGARTPRPRKITSSAHRSYSTEHRVDRLYLRAASQPKLTEKSYAAQLRPTSKMKLLQQQHLANLGYPVVNDDYQYQYSQQVRPKIIQNPCANLNNNFQSNSNFNNSNTNTNTNSKNNSNNNNNVNNNNNSSSTTSSSHHHHIKKKNSLRQTLVAITNDYISDSITLHKGEIVTLMECRETKDHRQWFYIKTRDGRQGFVPSEYAGHGFL